MAQTFLAYLQTPSEKRLAEFLVLNGFVPLISALFAGWLCGKYIEGLPFRAMGAWFTDGWLKHLMLGIVFGGATLGIAVLIAIFAGGLSFEFNAVSGGSAIFKSFAVSFLIFSVVAAFEEALFRGYILQTFSRSGLAWFAIILTSVIFGTVHLGNPDAGVISTINTILGGLWFAFAYLKTRDLWFVWGMHFMWNWLQGAFFGIEVSGLTEITTAPFLKEIDKGPAWLTGENYGIEGGIMCTTAILISITAIYILPIFKPSEEMLALTNPKKIRPQVSADE